MCQTSFAALISVLIKDSGEILFADHRPHGFTIFAGKRPQGVRF
jgi:hypothetical protein